MRSALAGIIFFCLLPGIAYSQREPDPAGQPVVNQDFLQKALLNESLWEKLISSE